MERMIFKARSFSLIGALLLVFPTDGRAEDRCAENVSYKAICEGLSSIDLCSKELTELCCSCEDAWQAEIAYCSFLPPTLPPVTEEEPEEEENPVAPNPPDGEGNCLSRSPEEVRPDCIDEPLHVRACAGVNGFLGQTNIASVINLQDIPLGITVEYRSASGVVIDSVRTTVAPLLKRDIIINDMGLLPDTVGTVCVITNAKQNGAWLGGVTLYKPDTREGVPVFGEAFDFAVHYPFTNPRSGNYTVPLNTFHLGADPQSTVANWISIADASPGDGFGLGGVIEYYDSEGALLGTDSVRLPDGGRFDYSGHEGVAGSENRDAVGMARFVPEVLPDGFPAKYYLTLTRYFYDCPGATCTDFLTAFTIPHRPGTEGVVTGGVSTVGDEISIVEVNNNSTNRVESELTVHGVRGELLGRVGPTIPERGTRHVIVNRAGDAGFLGAGEVGSALLKPVFGKLSTLSLYYKLDQDSSLSYAYAAPFAESPGKRQISEFNSFIKHTNSVELYNSTGEEIAATLTVLDVSGATLFLRDYTLLPHGSERISLSLPADTYGTIVLEASAPGVVMRNYLHRGGQYVMTFRGMG